ncbi:MAG: TrbC/VirB2 family protein [Candidatus Pacebacteria bacterium]|nr:TrbC/VirB2 family protein [Candidatus Paceibacterota bacterium]
MEKILKIQNKIQYLFILGVLFLPFSLRATTNVVLDNPIGGTSSTLAGFIDSILDVVVTIATPIAILAIIYSGFLFVKAQGNSSELEKAKKTLMWVLVGVAVLLGAQLLASVIEGTINNLKG